MTPVRAWVPSPQTYSVAVTCVPADAEEAGPVPALFVAVTVKVYVPGARPLKVQDVVADVQVAPLLAVTVYPVTLAPPFHDGAVQVTVAVFVPPVAPTPVGAAGVIVTPHLRARYSWTVRVWAEVAAVFVTTISAIRPFHVSTVFQPVAPSAAPADVPVLLDVESV